LWNAQNPDILHLFVTKPSMTDQQWNDLYSKLYAAYEYAGLKDEYVRSTLGDALDHMIFIKNSPLYQAGL
jgi:hypothetical protein